MKVKRPMRVVFVPDTYLGSEQERIAKVGDKKPENFDRQWVCTRFGTKKFFVIETRSFDIKILEFAELTNTLFFLNFPGEAPDGTRYKTAYACEGDGMAIDCEDDGDEQV